ncbi:MAG: hypothetical protein IKE36_00675 [Solobacterium sp.]|nr:hypothetical protein [Solobacterium sp.]
MKELKSVKKIQDILEDTKKVQSDTLEVIRERKEETQNQIREAQEMMNQAKSHQDNNKYMECREQLEKLNKILQILEAWKAETGKGEAISTEEYKSLVSEVEAEIQAEAEAYKKDFLKMAEEGYKKGNELLDLINQANQALNTLQHELYQDKDRTRTRNGTILYIIGENKEVNPDIWRVAEYGRLMAMSYHYQEYTGKRKQ